MMKLLSAIVAAFFAIAAVTPAFAEEKKDEKSPNSAEDSNKDSKVRESPGEQKRQP